MNFKEGDVIVCVNNLGFVSFGLEIGHRYKVLETSIEFSIPHILISHNGEPLRLFSNRFLLVKDYIKKTRLKKLDSLDGKD